RNKQSDKSRSSAPAYFSQYPLKNTTEPILPNNIQIPRSIYTQTIQPQLDNIQLVKEGTLDSMHTNNEIRNTNNSISSIICTQTASNGYKHSKCVISSPTAPSISISGGSGKHSGGERRKKKPPPIPPKPDKLSRWKPPRTSS
ncbi:4710_t:CDS:1, partial [Racocetra persica]